MDESELPKLAATQRLPLIGNVRNLGPQALLCRRCQKKLYLPSTLAKGHIRCRYCGELHRVGIPAHYARIVCTCGKILTAPLKFAGRQGRCPGCGKEWKVPQRRTPSKSAKPALQGKIPADYERIACSCGKILTAPKTAVGQSGRCRNCGRVFTIGASKEPAAKAGATKVEQVGTTQKLPIIGSAGDSAVAGLIRFRCNCGQPLMVEGEQRGATITCFRCQKDIVVPISADRDSSQLTAAPREQELELQIAEQWYLQTPYPTTDWWAVLELDPESEIAEVKKACRAIQRRVSRQDPLFQQAQMAKDTLCRVESRLWYELLSENLTSRWQGLAPKKYLKLHDRVVKWHQMAIELEKQRLYVKADPKWRRAINNWLKLAAATEFWRGVSRRGECLFAAKFKPEIVETLRLRLIDQVIIDISCQFRERYSAQENLIRAETHLRFLAPVIAYRRELDPGDAHSTQLLIAYLQSEIQSLAEQRRWKKISPWLMQLQPLAAGDRELENFIIEIFARINPHLAAGQRRKLAQYLGF